MKAVAIDIGGSSIKCAIIEKEERHFHIIEKEKTQIPEANIQYIGAAVLDYITKIRSTYNDIEIIGIATTGSVNNEGIVQSGGPIKDYANFDWKDYLQNNIQGIKTITVINDGKASARGSYVSEHQEFNSLVHFVVGTGIGGGIIINEKLIQGEHGYSGNVGHIKIASESDIMCVCKKTGCVETFAAGPAIIRIAQHALTLANNDLSLDIHSITISSLSEAANKGSLTAINIFKEAGEKLGIAIADVLNITDPGIITIGGGVVEAAHIQHLNANVYVDAAVKSALSLCTPRISEKAKIVELKIGNDAGVLGIGSLAILTHLEKQNS